MELTREYFLQIGRAVGAQLAEAMKAPPFGHPFYGNQHVAFNTGGQAPKTVSAGEKEKDEGPEYSKYPDTPTWRAVAEKEYRDNKNMQVIKNPRGKEVEINGEKYTALYNNYKEFGDNDSSEDAIGIAYTIGTRGIGTELTYVGKDGALFRDPRLKLNQGESVTVIGPELFKTAVRVKFPQGFIAAVNLDQLGTKK